jgi:hypothetical protein
LERRRDQRGTKKQLPSHQFVSPFALLGTIQTSAGWPENPHEKKRRVDEKQQKMREIRKT